MVAWVLLDDRGERRRFGHRTRRLMDGPADSDDDAEKAAEKGRNASCTQPTRPFESY